MVLLVLSGGRPIPARVENTRFLICSAKNRCGGLLSPARKQTLGMSAKGGKRTFCVRAPSDRSEAPGGLELDGIVAEVVAGFAVVGEVERRPLVDLSR